LSIAETLSRYPHLLVVGAPGSGKTTLSRWLAVIFAMQQHRERLGEHFQQQRLPIVLELRRFAARFQELAQKPHIFDLADEISQFIDKDARFSNIDAEWIQTALRNKSCLLLLDGLDEIPADNTRQRVLEAVNVFIEQPGRVGKSKALPTILFN